MGPVQRTELQKGISMGVGVGHDAGLHDPQGRQRLDVGLAASLGPRVATMLMTPRMTIADPKRQSRRQRQIGPPQCAQTRGSLSGWVSIGLMIS
jgi:hypothetical protein